jgi:HAD superfamily hydrolase (TIGR01490 family)
MTNLRSAIQNPKSVVFSDVEGTLINTSLPRLSLQVGREMGFFKKWQIVEFALFSVLGRITRGEMRQAVRLLAIKQAMAGQTEENVRRLVEAVLRKAMQYVKPAMLERLRAHQREGMPLVLLSAGPHEMIVRIGEELGGRGEGTRYIKRNGIYQARLDGPPCQGEGKAARARAICGGLGCDPAECYVYGDTANDIPFLELFGRPYAIDPDQQLAAEATRRGWPVIHT